MNLHGFRKWEVALMAGLLTGLLAAPAKAEALPVSRWQITDRPGPAQYQVSLFPFAVGQAEREAATVPPQAAQPEYQIKFQLVQWWETIVDSIGQ